MDRTERLELLVGQTRVWSRPSPENVTPGLISLCEEWIGPEFDVAEIGCFAGVGTAVFASFARSVLAVDPWSMVAGTDYNQVGLSMLLEARVRFQGVLANYPNVRCFQGFSLQAAKQVPDGSLDAVYLDGDHRGASVRADVLAWLPKLKVGGLLMGHDVDVLTHREVVSLSLPKPIKIYPETSWVMRVET